MISSLGVLRSGKLHIDFCMERVSYTQSVTELYTDAAKNIGQVLVEFLCSICNSRCFSRYARCHIYQTELSCMVYVWCFHDGYGYIGSRAYMVAG